MFSIMILLACVSLPDSISFCLAFRISRGRSISSGHSILHDAQSVHCRIMSSSMFSFRRMARALAPFVSCFVALNIGQLDLQRPHSVQSSRVGVFSFVISFFPCSGCFLGRIFVFFLLVYLLGFVEYIAFL